MLDSVYIKIYTIIAHYINDATIGNYFLLFRSNSIGAIFSKIERIVRNHNALSMVGTTSNKAAQSFTSTQFDTRLCSAQSVNAVNDNPIAIASL